MNKYMHYIVIIIISIFFVFCIYPTITENFNKYIPKIIWTYWDKPQIPEFVQICQKNWRKFAPNYKIHILHKNNVEEWVNMPIRWQNLPPYRQADILRLKLLEKYGGIWMDASILLMENPDKFVEGDLTLFMTPNSGMDNPVYENWFIASSRQNLIIKKWIKEVLIAIKNPKKYIDKSDKRDVELVKNPYYLICHLALRNVYRGKKGLFTNGKYINSNTTAFYLQNQSKWKINKNTFQNLTINPNRLMIKMRKIDRKNIGNIPQVFY
jgi:hypothetical protein